MLVVDMAVDAVAHPLARRYRDALVLGSLREDVAWLPLVDVVYEHLSLHHFNGRLPGGYLPFLSIGAPGAANRRYARALRRRRAGRTAAAFVELGRVAHLLADMACPAHVHRVLHVEDSFEWWVESHRDALAALPVPEVAPVARASDLIVSLARRTRALEPDRTSTPLGRRLRRMGLRRPPPRAALEAQARAIIPLAAGHTAALLGMFLAAQ
jgi:hypothetical protein